MLCHFQVSFKAPPYTYYSQISSYPRLDAPRKIHHWPDNVDAHCLVTSGTNHHSFIIVADSITIDSLGNSWVTEGSGQLHCPSSFAAFA